MVARSDIAHLFSLGEPEYFGEILGLLVCTCPGHAGAYSTRLWLLVDIRVSTRTESAWMGGMVLFKEGYTDLRGRSGSPRLIAGLRRGSKAVPADVAEQSGER